MKLGLEKPFCSDINSNHHKTKDYLCSEKPSVNPSKCTISEDGPWLGRGYGELV